MASPRIEVGGVEPFCGRNALTLDAVLGTSKSTNPGNRSPMRVRATGERQLYEF
jgi:hypothetical protein